MTTLTREQFIAGFAGRAGLTRAEFDEQRVALPCECGEAVCQGWIAVRRTVEAMAWYLGPDAEQNYLEQIDKLEKVVAYATGDKLTTSGWATATIKSTIDEVVAECISAALSEPIDMVLHCPVCGLQHIDAPERGRLVSSGPNAGRATRGWTNPPHRSHLCHGCGHIWRPADVPTNGVAAVKTRGTNDSPIKQPHNQY